MIIRGKSAIALFLTVLISMTLLPVVVVGEEQSASITEDYNQPQEQVTMVEFKELVEPLEIWDGSIATGYAGGTGTEDDPYLISNGAELAYLAQQVNAGNNYSEGLCFKLTAHIYLNDTTEWQNWETTPPTNNWTAIGIRTTILTNTLTSFKGGFDGDGFSVLGIYINKAASCQGLFGHCYASSISNLAVRDSYISGRGYIGGVIGYINSPSTTRSYTTNCINTGRVNGSGRVGGIVGHNGYYSTISDCYNTGSVNGVNTIGGVVGYNYTFSFVLKSYNTGTITTSDGMAGGVVGENSFDGTVTGCYNVGTVSGKGESIGGVVGSCRNIINNSYNAGKISGERGVGGVVGSGKSITNCYNIGEISGNSNVGGVSGSCIHSAIINSYNAGTVSGDSNVGGLVGYSASDVINCYNSGTISGTESAGAAVGHNFSSSVLDCYFLDTCGTESGVGYNEGSTITEATALTDTQLQLKESFSGFDFHNIWAIEPDTGYPYPQFMKYLDPSFGEKAAIWDGSISEGFALGSGTETDPYIIGSAEQLAYFASTVNSGVTYEDEYVELSADIILNDYDAKYWIVSATPWEAIGRSSARSFRGHFNGNGFTIRGIYIDAAGNCQGLFGYCRAATITDLCIEDSYIKGERYVGGIAGWSAASTIDKCVNKATINGIDTVGGIVGYNYINSSGIESKVVNCYNLGTVQGCNSVGGVAGENYPNASSKATVTDCTNDGKVKGGTYIGGVVGYNHIISTGVHEDSETIPIATVARCSNTGAIIGNESVGGIVGSNYSHYYSPAVEGIVTVKNSYNTGSVKANIYVGGVAGTNLYHSVIMSCYSTGNVDGQRSVGGVVGWNRAYSSSEGAVCNCIVDNCYNTGTINGSKNIGGVVGENDASATDVSAIATIENCYNIGTVSGDIDYAGIVGRNHANSIATAMVKNCYYLDSCSTDVGVNNAEGGGTETVTNSIVLTDRELRNSENYTGFDFIGDETGNVLPIWTMEGNTAYPYAELMAIRHDCAVPVTGIEATQTLEVGIGTSASIEYTIAPYDADDKSVKYFSTDTSIATVDENGVVTGVAEGQVTIVTTTNVGGFAVETEVTVHPSQTVNFIVDGETFASYTVGWNGTLELIPEVPEKEGYDKIAPYWDTDLTGVFIKADYTVTAVYTINTYTVTYIADDETVASYVVEWNGVLETIPEVPFKEKHWAEWDTDLLDIGIKKDYVISAIYRLLLYGDATAGGEVDSADASAILRYVVKIIDLTELGKIQGDVALPYSGRPDAADAAAILRYIVKLIPSLEP
ncbi:MAG: GLUG motif-containing protein [Clostridia bacterium]|nr:GLUG motif-containing protein [Clostridia bacterium]